MNRQVFGGWPIDLVLVLGLFAFALTVRLSFITLVPPLWDSEVSEALDAADIALGRTLPLVLPSQPHLGPVAAYPLALVLRVFGLSPFVPRMFVAVTGALTVASAYLLARAWGGRVAGLIAGMLLAINPFHIFINSHIFWTNSITPLLTTLALTALSVAIQQRHRHGPSTERIWLVLSALLFGLALQSHPSVLGLLPGVAIWLVAQRDLISRLRERWTWLAASSAIAAYANMIVFNLANGFRSVTVASSKSYALPEQSVAMTGYVGRLRGLTTEFLRMLNGYLPESIDFDLPIFAVTAWFVLALLIDLKKRRGLFFWTTLSTALVIGYSNKVYNAGFSERYIMFLLPIAFVAMGLAVDDVWQWLVDRQWPRGLVALVGLAGIITLAYLFSQPLSVLDDYYRQEVELGRSNQAYAAWNESAVRYAQSGYSVMIGRQLDQEQVIRFGSTYGTVLDYLLRMQGIATLFESVEDLKLALSAAPQSKTLLLLERGEFASLRRVVPLCVVEEKPRSVMAVYPGAGASCAR